MGLEITWSAAEGTRWCGEERQTMAGAFFRLQTFSPTAMANVDTELPLQLPKNVRNSRVLVLGGTGRVGASTATALSKFCPDLQIVIGGRNR